MDLQKIEKELLSRLAEKCRTDALIEETPAHDQGDTARGVSEKEMAAGQLEDDHVQRIKIRMALGRLKNGDYGYCLECGLEIAEKRIRAVPETPFCVTCQEKLDRHELGGYEYLQASHRARAFHSVQ